MKIYSDTCLEIATDTRNLPEYVNLKLEDIKLYLRWNDACADTTMPSMMMIYSRRLCSLFLVTIAAIFFSSRGWHTLAQNCPHVTPLVSSAPCARSRRFAREYRLRCTSCKRPLVRQPTGSSCGRGSCPRRRTTWRGWPRWSSRPRPRGTSDSPHSTPA